MKKLAIIIAIVLGISVSASAQWGGGLFQHGPVSDEEYYGAAGYRNDPFITLPNHGANYNQDAAPLGSGALLLIGFGAAYMAAKRKKE